MGFNLGGLVASMFSKGIESNPGFGIKAPGDVPYNVTGDPEEWMKKHPADEPAMRPSWSKRQFEPDASRAQEMANFNYKMQPALAEQELAAKVNQLKALDAAQRQVTRDAFRENYLKIPDALKGIAPQSNFVTQPTTYTADEAYALGLGGNSPMEREAGLGALARITRDLPDLSADQDVLTNRFGSDKLKAGLGYGIPDLMMKAEQSRLNDAIDTNKTATGERVIGDLTRPYRLATALTEAERLAAAAKANRSNWPIDQNTTTRDSQAKNIQASILTLPGTEYISIVQPNGTVLKLPNPAAQRLKPEGGGFDIGSITGLGNVVTPSVGGKPSAVKPSAVTPINIGGGKVVNPVVEGLSAFGAPKYLRPPVSDGDGSVTNPPPKVDYSAFYTPGLKAELTKGEEDVRMSKMSKLQNDIRDLENKIYYAQQPRRPVQRFAVATEHPLPIITKPNPEAVKKEVDSLVEKLIIARKAFSDYNK